jgi:Chromo (CHRromatin Organisation MOdifier) domain
MWLKLRQRKKGQRQFKLLKKGKQVWLEGTNLKLSHPSAKLAPRRYGPFPIIDVISPVVYRIQLPLHWHIHDVFHVSLLTPYKETDAHGRNFSELPPDLIEGEPEYEVDQILTVRRHGCNQDLQYLLCWKGYSQAHNSWEPAENVTAPELIKEFYERNPNAEGGGRIKGRRKRQKICTITSTPTPLTTINNALQILLKYPYSEEEYFSILKATFTIEALAIRGQWSILGTSSAKDSLESISIIATTTIPTEEGETPDSRPPQSSSPVELGEFTTTPSTQSMSISPTLPESLTSGLRIAIGPPLLQVTLLISCRELIAQMGMAYVHPQSCLQHVGGCLLVIQEFTPQL